VTHHQSAPASIAFCVRDVGVWHIGHVGNSGAHFSSSTTADVTCGREERCVIGNSLKKIS